MRVIFLTLQELIEKNNHIIYIFSKERLVPKTTLQDLCNGRTSIYKCHAIIIKRIADTLDFTMEYIMSLESPNKEYLELNISDFLKESISEYKKVLILFIMTYIFVTCRVILM